MELKGIYEVVFKLGEQTVVDYTKDVWKEPFKLSEKMAGQSRLSSVAHRYPKCLLIKLELTVRGGGSQRLLPGPLALGSLRISNGDRLWR